MHKIVATAGLLVLAIGGLGTPAAAAAKADLAIVQGIPGKVVDVCLDGREIGSGLRYGGKLSRSVKPGAHRLTFHARHGGECQGARLARKVLDLEPAGDVSVVATARKPKVVVFDNAGVDALPPLAEGSFAVRHAADLGSVVMHLDFSDSFPLTPTADPEFEKRSQFTAFFIDDLIQLWAAYQLTPADPIAALIIHLKAGHRYELVLVGTRVRNARFVIIRKALEP